MAKQPKTLHESFDELGAALDELGRHFRSALGLDRIRVYRTRGTRYLIWCTWTVWGIAALTGERTPALVALGYTVLVLVFGFRYQRVR